VDTGGCLLSEYPPGTPGFKQNFIARNRIIAGISIGTVIVECDLKSGSLITAQYALDQNRRVYAVPGPIYSAESRGPNNLIKMGAQLVTESNDILNDLNIVPQSQLDEIPKADNPAEGIVLGILSSNPLSADELIQRSGLDAALLTTTLTFLEMKGRIKNLGAQQYIRSR
jgi:DNA processing protein